MGICLMNTICQSASSVCSTLTNHSTDTFTEADEC